MTCGARSHRHRSSRNVACACRAGAVYLNPKHHVLKHIAVYIGSINSSAVRSGEVFKEALKQNTAAIMFVPNHF